MTSLPRSVTLGTLVELGVAPMFVPDKSITKGDLANVRGFKTNLKKRVTLNSAEQNSEMTQLQIVEENDTWPSGTSWQHTNPWRSECSIVHNRRIRHIGPPIISSRQHVSACLKHHLAVTQCGTCTNDSVAMMPSKSRARIQAYIL